MASITTATQTIREEEEVRHLAVYLSLRSERESGERERENFLAKSSTFERKSHRRKKKEQFFIRVKTLNEFRLKNRTNNTQHTTTPHNNDNNNNTA